MFFNMLERGKTRQRFFGFFVSDVCYLAKVKIPVGAKWQVLSKGGRVRARITQDNAEHEHVFLLSKSMLKSIYSRYLYFFEKKVKASVSLLFVDLSGCLPLKKNLKKLYFH